MSDHNFEKQIQQKLEELKIPPANTVWTGVEAQIRKDKRRRRGVIFFPLLFLLIGACCYFIFQNTVSFTNNSVTKSSSPKSNPYSNDSTSDNSKTANDETVKDREEENTDNTTIKSATKDPRLEQSHRKETSEIALSSKKIGNNSVRTKKIQVYNPEYGLEKTFNKNTAGTRNKKQQYKSRKQEERITEQMVADLNITENSQNKTIDLKKQDEGLASIDKEDKKIVSAPDLQANKIMNDLVDNQVDDSINNLKQQKPADTLLSDKLVAMKRAADQKIKQSGWKWGMNASAGISNLIDDGFFTGVLGGVLSEDKALVADVSNNSANNSPAPNAPTGIIHKPSAIEKGPSFSVGVFIEKNLSKRFTISTGIQYHLYSTNIQVGNRVDSSNVQVQNAFGSQSVNQFYRSAPVTTTHNYTNLFQFIELPVLIHAQLNKSNRVPIFWNAGLSLSYLVSTNALHFHGNTGVYYMDNGLFNKLQANFSTGFSVSVWNASKTPVHIGPQLQYGFTNLMKREVSASKHLYYFGLNTKVFLKK